MAFTYKTPGVYIEEIAKLPASIAPVSTAIPAFLGYTETGDTTPKRIGSFLEYVSAFGGPNDQVLVELTGTINTAGDVEVTAIDSVDYLGHRHHMYYAVEAYFQNGGGDCWILSTGNYPSQVSAASTGVVKDDYDTAISELKKLDEPTLIVLTDATSFSHTNWASVNQSVLAQCANLQDRFAIIDIKEHSSDTLGNFRTNIGTENLKYGAAYFPNLVTGRKRAIQGLDGTVNDANVALRVLEDGTSAWATLETLPDLTGDETGPLADNWTLTGITVDDIRDEVLAEAETVAQGLLLQPASVMAGIYARVDRTRGVWKAPANVSVRGVEGPEIKLTDNDQADYNVHTTGKSVNVIRQFAGKGTIVWGARTLAGNDNEWRYVPVRRLYIMAEESIKKATEAVVFEPNNANTWTRVRGMIENFLSVLWRQGALAGATPEQAFFVNVGLGETMSPQDILEGRLIVEIGMAAVRPAEFIILRFSHKLQEA